MRARHPGLEPGRTGQPRQQELGRNIDPARLRARRIMREQAGAQLEAGRHITGAG
jgi:hypothetical protein